MSRVKGFFSALVPPRQTLYLWVGGHSMQWGLLTGRGKQGVWQELGSTDIRGEGEAVTLAVLCAALRDLSIELPLGVQAPELRVVIAETWLPVASIPWSPALLNRDSAQAFARDYLANLGFDVAADDEIRLDDAPYGAARLAIAYPQTLLQSIEACATRWHVHWRGLRPLALLAWSALSRSYPARALALFDRSATTLCLGVPKRSLHRSRLLDVKTQAQPSGHMPADAVNLVWERLCLRQPQMAEIEEVLVVETGNGASLPVAWHAPFVQPDELHRRLQPNLEWLRADTGVHALDARAHSPRRGAARWLALAALLAIAGGLAFESSTQFKRANASRAAYEATQQVKRVAPPPIWNRDELARIAVVNAAIRQVNLPIGAVLQALRPPQDIRVAVLQVETAVALDLNTANTLKITAEAASSAEMTRYVAFVSDRKPFIRAYLTHHEVSGDDAKRFRFTMEAQWDD